MAEHTQTRMICSPPAQYRHHPDHEHCPRPVPGTTSTRPKDHRHRTATTAANRPKRHRCPM
eukprot:2965530-Prymnesium_polylepis.1